jgi:hypothetical protein
MDKHYLTPLFSPDSIVVFAGRADDPALEGTHAAALHEALRAQRFGGTLQFLDIHTSGTLADLAQSRADLAIIALPPQDVAAALEIAGRMTCRSALVTQRALPSRPPSCRGSRGAPAAPARPELLGLSVRCRSSSPAPGRWRRRSLPWCRSRAR